MKALAVLLVAVAGAAGAETPPDPERVAAGEAAFAQCRFCHQTGPKARNRAGPVLNGIVGAPAGGVAEFRYSEALQAQRAAGLVWDIAALDAYLADPGGFMPGTSMGFAGVASPGDRAALIAYLASVPR